MSTPSMLFLSFALKGTALLAVASIVALAVRRESAAFRHWVWAVGLFGLVLVPFLSAALPSWNVVRLPEVGPRVFAISPVPAVAPVAAIPGVPPVAVGTGRSHGAIVAAAPQPVAPAEAISPAAVAVPAVAPVPATSATGGVPLARLLVLIWAAGAGLLLGWIGLGEIGVRRYARRAVPAEAPEWAELVPEALDALGMDGPVRVIETDEALVPMTFGIVDPVVIVPSAGREWSEAHRRDVLLHELAHVRRRDCLTHLLARIGCALHWFNPLAWIALRQLRIEREHACDDAVLNAGALPSRYAEELLSTAQSMAASPSLAHAGLGMARRSQLADRLLSVLDAGRRRTPLGGRSQAGLVAAGAALMLPLAAMSPRAAAIETPVVAPAPAALAAGDSRSEPMAGIVTPAPVSTAAPAAPGVAAVVQRDVICPPGPKGQEKTVHLTSSMTISGQGNASDGKNSYVVWTGADCSVVIRTTGTVRFTEDEQDVASISDGGRFSVTHEEGDRTRDYTVTVRSGELARRYLVDGKTAEMDADFAAWRGAIVLEFIRRSAYDAERRARRILAQRGVDGVLAEIALIPNDWGRGQYFRTLVRSTDLDPATAARLVSQAGRSIESDYELGQVLAVIPPRTLADEAVRRAFVTAAGTMDSDYEKRKVLAAVLAAGRPDAAVTSAMLDLAGTIDSDYDVAELLIGIARSGAMTGEFDPAYLKALRTIESDYEKHRVMSALLASGPHALGTLKAGLETAGTIDSDYEAAGLLKEIARAAPIGDELRPAYFAAADRIESDFERHAVLSAVLATKSPSPALVADVLRSAAGIDSDYELASLLVEVAGRGLVTADLRPLFRRAVDTIDSEHERQRALAAIGARMAET